LLLLFTNLGSAISPNKNIQALFQSYARVWNNTYVDCDNLLDSVGSDGINFEGYLLCHICIGIQNDPSIQK
tara:strand:- start:124 stop:336 length:213 start_codon:yes stop_codon:yes gene_type:complete